jgi:hypothetical protein
VMATKIIKPEVQIVPLVDQKSLSLALSELQDELQIVPELRAKAEALKVTNAAEFAEAGALRADVRSRRKVPRFKLAPFQEVAKRVVDFLRTKHSEAEQQFDAIDQTITAKMDAHARAERLAAEAEQRRINEERRLAAEKEAAERRKEAEKQAEADRKQREKEIEAARKAGEIKAAEAKRLQKEAEERAKREKEVAAREQVEAAQNVESVTVKPNLPTVAGSRRRIVYCFEVVNPDQVKSAFRCPDEQAIGRKVRDDQDVEKSMSEVGGIRVWTEDRT